MDKIKLEATAISFMLTATADTLQGQKKKTAEELREFTEAVEHTKTLGPTDTKKITADLHVAMEAVDVLKSSFNELRIECKANGLDFEKVLRLNDLNNDVRGYHGK